MSELLIKNAIVYTAEKCFEGWVYCEDGRIASIGQGDAHLEAEQVTDADGKMLLPGFIDTHVHGAVGHDTMDADVDGLIKMAQFFASKGVTAFTPTTLSSSHDDILSALKTVTVAMNQDYWGAEIAGVHLEGPYLNVEKCGAQNPDFVRLCDPDEARQYLDTGVISIVSLAPEFEANHWLIRECKRRGITASIAHTNASYEQALESFEPGISQSTHTFNAMTGLHHRNPGVVGAVLSDDRITCELIADKIHVHIGVMKTLWKAKGRVGIILITDSMRAAGMPDGEYKLENLTVYVKDGRASLSNGTLAGSIVTMDKAIQNFLSATGSDLHAILPTFTLNPARAIGVDGRKGSISVGKDADLVIIDDKFEIYQTIIAGEFVYLKS